MCGKYIGFELPSYGTPYERGNSGYKRAIEIEGETENLAAFIASREDNSRFIITDEFDKPFIETRGTFIFSCRDKEFLQSELLPELIPLQRGDRVIPMVNINRELSMEEFRAEREAEEENELEM
ncbi:hypothetical protein [Enterococcus hulanensis]|uniref:hypothetical protein n=1 Tax=Enterococcus hulanensis TaxID=2559929 RepID=UPI0010F4EC13|nr:hypothetical protein [Enterococcus hulanensis]